VGTRPSTQKIIRPLVIVLAVTQWSFVYAAKAKKKASAPKAKTTKVDSKPAPPAPASREIPGSPQTHGIGLGIGQTMLYGDFDENGENKITTDLYYSYAASHSFDLLINIHRSKHEYQGRHVILPGIAPGIKAKLFQFDSFSPYVLAGLGLYRPKIQRPVSGQLLESEGKITFGMHFGAGVDLRLNKKFSVGFMTHLHSPFDVKQDVGNDVEGTYMKLLITGMYHFSL